MEGTPRGGASTIERPQLPPLPGQTRAVRGVPDPFRGPAPGTQVEGIAPPAAVVPADAGSEVPPTPAAPSAPAAPDSPVAPAAPAAPLVTSVEDIERPILPPTPSALTPLTSAALSPLVAGAGPDVAATSTSSRSEALRNAEPQSPAGVVRPETPEALRRLEEAKTSKTDKKAKAKTKTKKATKTKGSGSSNLPALVGVLLAVVVIGLGLFFGSRFVGQGTSVSELSTGQCIENFFPTDESGAFIEISSLSTIDCGQPHAYEVFAVNTTLFEGTEYPGVDASFTQGEEFCLNEYEDFIGGGRANLRIWEVWTFVPPESAWESAPFVQCVVGDAGQSELVTGTLRGVASPEAE